MTLRDRLTRLESAAAPATMEVIEITGGFGTGPDHAEADGQTWEREPGETLAAFRTRTEAEARAAGATFLVIGGLRH